MSGLRYTVGMVQVETIANAVFQTAYHLVWIPKYRRRVLGGAVAEQVRHVVQHIADRNRWHVLAMAIQPDHLHFFLSVPPTIAVAEAVRRLKRASARHLRVCCPQLQWMCRGGTCGHPVITWGRPGTSRPRRFADTSNVQLTYPVGGRPW